MQPESRSASDSWAKRQQPPSSNCLPARCRAKMCSASALFCFIRISSAYSSPPSYPWPSDCSCSKPIVGFGLNTYVFAVPPYTDYGPQEAIKVYQGWIPAVHNIYLLWLAETGAVGFLIFMTMWGSIIWIGIRNLRVQHDVLFTINAACLSAMAAFIVDGFFSFSLRINSICRTFWVLS